MEKGLLGLEGRSGCNLQIIDKSGALLVKKTSSSSEYNNRLKEQYLKQKTFQELRSQNNFFVTPSIKDFIESSSSTASFEMQYIRGQSYADYIMQANVVQLKTLINKLIDFVAHNLQEASLEVLEPEIILNKLNQIKQLLTSRKDVSSIVYDTISTLEKSIPEVAIPLGYSHGDLTFSNQIFTPTRVYLIDFLDSFIDTPINDLVKLRQDTFFHWTPFIDNNLNSYQETKIIQVFRYFDEILLNYIRANPEIKEWYLYLEKLNFLRIVPYVQNKNELLFIEESLTKIFSL